MSEQPYRALVVEDEEAVRNLTVRALTGEGFLCDVADNGQDGKQLADRVRYDVVVSDLRMPVCNGHSLVVDLIEREDRPMVVVLTGVVEPRIAKDLFARGVDDVVYKPVDYGLFALKVKALVARHRLERGGNDTPETGTSKNGGENGESTSPEATPQRRAPVTLSDVELKLSQVSNVLPISKTALDVFGMANADTYSAQQLAAAIQRDASLTLEVLRLANSTFYNPSGKKIVDLEEAVPRIGQKHVGELALASNALAALTAGSLPWMDVELAWRRSVAAGVAVEWLADQGGHRDLDEGLLLSAIMHSLGRVVLATLYPMKYEAMTEACRRLGGTLQ